MLLVKALIIGFVMVALLGSAGLFVLANAGTLIDESRDIVPRWDRGGGCHGGYYAGDTDRDTNSYPSCHDVDDGYNGGYCPYHDAYFTTEEWKDHRDDCPYYNNTTQAS